MGKESKSKDLTHILHAMVSLEVSKGHLKWKLSDLSRKSGIKRPLIYYHFGKTKKAIFENGVLTVANEYFGLTEERLKMLSDGRAYESLMLTRKMIQENPSFAIFYLKWRSEKSPLQKKLIEIEKKYQKTLKKLFPKSTDSEIVAFHGVFYSIVVAPFLDEAAIETMLGFVNDNITKRSQ